MRIVIQKKRLFIIIITLVILVLFVGGAYAYIESRKESDILGIALQESRKTIEIVKARARELADTLEQKKKNLEAEQAKNTMFESQIREISGAVGTLTKLSETDKELLQKYSKVYFLSENYAPSHLLDIDTAYLWEKAKPQQIHANAMPFLSAMLTEASSSASTSMRIVSGYRSFSDQISVKSGYKTLYGSGANQFSADQGYSEHQLGTAIDITTPKLDGLSLQFEKQPAYVWLMENAHRFGFVLSYPKGNAYYQFEPWHWRFVGVALATKLHNDGKYFYDLTQREIDVYLISIFDR